MLYRKSLIAVAMSMALAMPAFAETASLLHADGVQTANTHPTRGNAKSPRDGQGRQDPSRPHDSVRDPKAGAQTETEHEKRSCSNMRYTDGEPITPPLERCL